MGERWKGSLGAVGGSEGDPSGLGRAVSGGPSGLGARWAEVPESWGVCEGESLRDGGSFRAGEAVKGVPHLTA